MDVVPAPLTLGTDVAVQKVRPSLYMEGLAGVALGMKPEMQSCSLLWEQGIEPRRYTGSLH